MRRALLLIAACSAPSAAPAPARPQPTPPADAPAELVDASPARPRVSVEFGPVLDKLTGHSPRLQDHELTLTTEALRIVIGGSDPAAVRVEPLHEAGFKRSPDGTWAVQVDSRAGVIVAGALANGTLVKPVAIHRTGPVVRYLGNVADQRTVVLDRGNWGWFVVRSQDGGKTWKKTELNVIRTIDTSSRSYDLVTRDPNWVRIDREGDVTTIPISKVVPDSYACAANHLWASIGDELMWFDDKTQSTVAGTAQGQMICAGEDVLVPVQHGITRCTHRGCGSPQPAGDFADLTADGIATATQVGTTVRITRTNAAPIDLQLEPGERVVGLAVWNDVPTLVVLGANSRLHLATAP